MSPGQRRYIERRLTRVEKRIGWMQHHMNKSDTPEWMQTEYPELEARAAGLRARLDPEGAAERLAAARELLASV